MKNILLKFVFFASFNDLVLFNNLKNLKKNETKNFLHNPFNRIFMYNDSYVICFYRYYLYN